MADQGQQPGGRPAGWKKDPSGRHFGRWWDGQRWTENVISAEKVQSLDPMPPPPEPALFPDSPPAPPPAARASLTPAQPAVRYRGPAPTAPGWVPEPSTVGTAEERQQAAFLIMGGAGAVAIGCFLPWAKLTAPFIGTISKAGIEGDGVSFLGLAAAAAGVAFAFARRVPASISLRRWSLAVLIAVLGLFSAFEVTDLAGRFAEVSDSEFPVSTSYGAGLWLVGIGVVVAAVGWVRMPWAQLQRQDEGPAPAR